MMGGEECTGERDEEKRRRRDRREIDWLGVDVWMATVLVQREGQPSLLEAELRTLTCDAAIDTQMIVCYDGRVQLIKSSLRYIFLLFC